MSKKKPKYRKTGPTTADSGAAETPEGHTDRQSTAKWWREAIESIVIAIVLAFLFRTFEAEAFVIPTGSMAPTLQGRHKDVVCDQCGFRYRAGASLDNEHRKGPVIFTTCPMCSFSMPLGLAGMPGVQRTNPNHVSFTGDRILVNKFAYQFGEPKRWDVFVFKFPGNAKQNYIKRLVGLPGEKVRIKHGDIYIQAPDEPHFQIARKPPHKLKRMLQPVHDTTFIPDTLIDAGWPSRWQPSGGEGADAGDWTSDDGGRTFDLPQAADSEAWLRYRHIVPTYDDWDALLEGQAPPALSKRRGELISDFQAYNAFIHGSEDKRYFSTRLSGMHWVGDLAVECHVEMLDESGQLILDLVEAGRRYECRIDVSDGSATLSIDGGAVPFDADAEEGAPPKSRTANTKVRGPGKHRLVFANVDDQLLLWVGGRLVDFDGPTTYEPPAELRPAWSESDPGDLSPVGIGSQGTRLHVDRLRVLRDIYYVATDRSTAAGELPMDYKVASLTRGYSAYVTPDDVRLVFSTPEMWDSTPLFALRRHVDFELDEDQFFPLGDNSPQSKDGRLWESPPYVHRRLLTGKAFLIYWPHPWSVGVPLTNVVLPVFPNFWRMGLIR